MNRQYDYTTDYMMTHHLVQVIWRYGNLELNVVLFIL